jgi:hypothetical protein
MTNNSRIQLSAMFGALVCAFVTFSLSLEPTLSNLAVAIT